MLNNKYIQTVSLAALLLFSISANSACLTAETEPNDYEGEANSSLCSDTTVEGNLSRNDIDWFTFDM